MSENTMILSHPRDKWIPWYFVIFFVVLAVVDGVLVYLAVSTQTGVVSKTAYETGLKYNQTLAAQERQVALGWASDITFHPEATGHAGEIAFTLHDKQGKALEGAEVVASIFRPVQAGFDFNTPLHAGSKSGIYSKRIDFPLPGVWMIKVKALWQGQTYQSAQRIRVP